MIGRTLGHYRIVEKLGEGGMGVVYLAQDTRLGRNVALKFLPQAALENPDNLVRFEREAKVVAALSHPNIVTLYTVEEHDDIRYLTMELVDGKTLDELIPRQGFDPAQLLRLAVPLADAIALSFIAPVLTAVFGVSLLGERLDWRIGVALAAGLAGMLLIVGGKLGGAGLDRDAAIGALAVVMSAIGYALNVVVLRHRATRDEQAARGPHHSHHVDRA